MGSRCHRVGSFGTALCKVPLFTRSVGKTPLNLGGAKPVKNVDLWQRLEKALEPHEVSWNWVKGHSGDAGNERADELARMGIPEGK